MTDALTTRSFWDKTAGVKNYPDPFSRGDVELKHIFRDILSQKRGGKILEMGCGNSYWLPWFFNVYGMRVYGIDYSLPRLDRAGRNYTENTRMYADLACQDFAIPVKDWLGQMDVVYSAGVIEHFKDSSEILKLFTDYLKPDGILITTVPHLKGFWGNLAWKINKEAAAGYKVMCLSDLVKAHEDAGLKIISYSYFRWLDPSVLNFGRLPPILQKILYVLIFGWNIFAGMLGKVDLIDGDLCADMVVIAKK